MLCFGVCTELSALVSYVSNVAACTFVKVAEFPDYGLVVEGSIKGLGIIVP